MILFVLTIVVFYCGYFMGMFVTKGRCKSLFCRLYFEEGFNRGYKLAFGNDLNDSRVATKSYLQYLHEKKRKN